MVIDATKTPACRRIVTTVISAIPPAEFRQWIRLPISEPIKGSSE